MTSAYGDVRNSNVALVASSKLEVGLLLIWHYQMHHPGAVLFKGETLKQQVVRVLRNVLVHVDKSVANTV